MKRNVYLLLIFFISIIIGIENISAVSASDYRVGKFIYYDPVNNETCTSNNYWTVYNQNTTCYRWAVINTYAKIDVIRIMIDHDIGISNFEDRDEVYADAIEAWDIPPLSEEQKEYLGIASSSNGNGIGSLGTNMVMKLSIGNFEGQTAHRYEFNSAWENINNAYYVKKSPNLIKFIYSNIQFYNNGDIKYNYDFSDTETKRKEGYWLSDSMTEHQTNISDDYAFYMNKDGNMYLSSKTDIRGVRVTAYIDIKTLNNALYYDPEISLKNNLVVEGTNYTNYYPQGFTTIGDNKHMFYLAPHNDLDEKKDKGIMLYSDGTKFVEAYKAIYGHGNALAFNKNTNDLYVTAKLYPNYNGAAVFNILSRKIEFNDENKLIEYDANDYCAFEIGGVCKGTGTLAVNDDGTRIYHITDQTIYIRDNEWNILYTIDIPEYNGTLQNLTYLDGYIYVAVYEGCVKDYQNYCYGKEHSLNIYVYNAKFNPDGTPNRWFGHRVDSYYSYDISEEYIHEIEGVGAYNDTLYIGLVKKTSTANGYKYAPVIYKYNPTFYTVNYILGNNTHTKKVYENRFVDMGLTLNNKTYDNGFIGWKAPDGTIYTNPEGISLRINENTNLNGVYIDLPKNYTFDNNNIKISKQVAIGDLLNEIKAYNSEIKVKRNNQIVTNTNEYIQYNDTLVVSNGTTELKTYNLIPTKYQVKYIDGSNTYEIEYNESTEISLKSDLTKKGYTLVGWKDLNDNKVYTLNEKYMIKESNVVFESIWEANNYNVSYNANGGTGTMENSSHIYDVEKSLSKNVFTKTGYTFKGWSTSVDGEVEYQDVQSVKNLTSVYEDLVTLYAVWEPNKYTVIYNANSGIGTMENSIFTYDVQEKLSKNAFTKTGYKFKGWSTSSSGITVYQDEHNIKNLTTEGTINLYASWEAVNEVNIDDVINNKYLIKDKKLYNIPKKTGVENLVLGLNSNYSYKIYDEANENILTDGYVGTGNLLKVYLNDTLKKEYRVIIKGDVTGEGEIEVNDVAKLYQYIKGKRTMEDYYKEAANVEESNSDLAVSDVAKLYQYIKGKITSLEV